jgi:primary-amine oxidase
VLLEEFFETEEVVKNDPGVQEALRKRGITEFDGVMVDPWSAGHYGDEEQGRLLRGLVWMKMGGPDDNGYAHPVENLVVYVDTNARRVVKIEDHGVVPVPQQPGNYTPDVVAPRTDLRPVEITQPLGTSFAVDGHEVRWQKWRFRVGFTPREGLVLHTVSYTDGARERSVLYRASLSEMVVPYGDPAPTHRRKNAFDAGEYNIGTLANPLELGCAASARSTTSTRCSPTPTATRSPSRTRCACTRRTTACSGSTPTSAPRRPRSAGRDGW